MTSYGLIPAFVITTIHILIFRAIKKKTKDCNAAREKNRIRQLRKISKTFCLIAAAFFVLVLPRSIYTICLCLLAKHKPQIFMSSETGEIFHITKIILDFLNTFNSCISPILYVKIHVRVRKLWQKFRKERNKDKSRECTSRGTQVLMLNHETSKIALSLLEINMTANRGRPIFIK